MRYFTLALAMMSIIGIGAAQAQQSAMKGHEPIARGHRQPTAHRILAEAVGTGADIQAARHIG
jgi:hypothetical protein